MEVAVIRGWNAWVFDVLGRGYEKILILLPGVVFDGGLVFVAKPGDVVDANASRSMLLGCRSRA